ncbi:hypothetical protein CCO34_19015 [Salmonella enterica subsp. enterica serovar Hadar]|nr:hypothetical protein [Salmonella enterica subsp. enterica serovar Manchester]OZU56606.1 hypothetical protein CCO34_19015 [Salmonella enterica subsp. enterica serovar Hadar]
MIHASAGVRAGFFSSCCCVDRHARSRRSIDPFFSLILTLDFTQAALRLASLHDGCLMRSFRDRFLSRVKHENSFDISLFCFSCHLWDRKNLSQNCKKFPGVKFQIFAFPLVAERAGGHFCTPEN